MHALPSRAGIQLAFRSDVSRVKVGKWIRAGCLKGCTVRSFRGYARLAVIQLHVISS